MVDIVYVRGVFGTGVIVRCICLFFLSVVYVRGVFVRGVFVRGGICLDAIYTNLVLIIQLKALSVIFRD